jgi:uncharacterized secreted protein with C-terminal beta-propeller domain
MKMVETKKGAAPSKEKKMGGFAMRSILAATFICLMVTGLLVFSLTAGAPAYIAGDLPVVGSYANLKLILERTPGYMSTILYRGTRSGVAVIEERAVPAAAADGALKFSQSADTGYSTTNVQVQGVDEADVVKTDGKYIYQVSNNRVVITLAYPADGMRVAEILLFAGDFHPRELYVDDEHLVVIGHTYSEVRPPAEPAGSRIGFIAPYRGVGLVRALVYDIRDKDNIVQVRELELEGHYISSRKIGSALYIAANRHVDYHHIQNEETEAPTPVYRDSAAGKDYKSVRYDEIRYFPNSPEPNYLLVAGIDLAKGWERMAVQTFLGAGQNVCASADNLYVAVTQFETTGDMFRGGEPPAVYTGIYRFALADGTVSFGARGRVPGVILNQFSMDEHRGFFRVATTSGDMWRDDQFTSKNNVYILDRNLEAAGRLEGLAPGERIYSARFMGDRGYMVTFRTVDPLFVIDLKDPYHPRVLGELKIPGYSDYLHPFDENHLIGFGKEAVEVNFKNWDGSWQEMAFYLGMKVSLFDVTDVANPVERFKVNIGDRGTESELLYNHKALLFDYEKGLLAFPVTLMEVQGTPVDDRGFPAYGRFVFQGLYIFDLTATNGFSLRGRITHQEGEGMTRGRYSGNHAISRALYIGETLYALSADKISAHHMSDLSQINTLQLR